MSGGHFEYNQCLIPEIAEEIERVIATNDKSEYPYDSRVIDRLKHAAKNIRVAYIFAQRVDWLLSGDDGPEKFLQRLNDELIFELTGEV